MQKLCWNFEVETTTGSEILIISLSSLLLTFINDVIKNAIFSSIFNLHTCGVFLHWGSFFKWFINSLIRFTFHITSLWRKKGLTPFQFYSMTSLFYDPSLYLRNLFLILPLNRFMLQLCCFTVNWKKIPSYYTLLLGLEL